MTAQTPRCAFCGSKAKLCCDGLAARLRKHSPSPAVGAERRRVVLPGDDFILPYNAAGRRKPGMTRGTSAGRNAFMTAHAICCGRSGIECSNKYRDQRQDDGLQNQFGLPPVLAPRQEHPPKEVTPPPRTIANLRESIRKIQAFAS